MAVAVAAAMAMAAAMAVAVVAVVVVAICIYIYIYMCVYVYVYVYVHGYGSFSFVASPSYCPPKWKHTSFPLERLVPGRVQGTLQWSGQPWCSGGESGRRGC